MSSNPGRWSTPGSDTRGEDAPTITLEHADSPSPGPVRVGSRVIELQRSGLGRYAILDELGRGGMARVYRAYDPKLCREVALKVLELDALDDSEARARALREAQAMAQLAHPNVVPVYDVELDERSLFITMEYVAGTTLRRWLAHEPRPWPEVLRVFEQAARGLVAAHDVNVVHRDFKPGNVMVGDDGRVRVMDFGLAAVGTVVVDTSSEHHDSTPSMITEELTRSGIAMGTPAYMSPEQHHGHRVDARTDQFSLCVALFEAVYGTRPFRGRSMASLLERKLQGPPPIPESPRVPKRVRRALSRGLHPDPEARFDSVHELLQQIAPPRAGRRGLVLGATIAALGSTAAAAGYVQAQRADLCSGSEARRQQVWSEDRRETLRTAMLATEVSYAEDSATRSLAQIDAWAERWQDARQEVCEATSIRGEQSETTMDLRQACLDRRLHRVDALLRVLEDPDEALMERAVELTSDLPPLDPCDDVEGLLAATPLPEDPSARVELEQILDEHDHSEALYKAARYREATELIERLLPRAEPLGYEPVLARLHASLGITLLDEGRIDDAEQHLLRSYELALGSGDDEIALESALKLTNLLGARAGRDEETKPWVLAARALVHRLGDPPRRVANLEGQLAERAMRAGQTQAALANMLEALALIEQVQGPDDVGTGLAHLNLGVVLFGAHRQEDAVEHIERAREIFVTQLGHTHPYVLYTHNNLGVINAKLGRYDEAERHHRKALAGRVAALGPDHPTVAVSHTNLAMTLQEQQRYDEAAEHHRDSVEITERTLGSDSANLTPLLNNLGSLQRLQGDLEGALASHRRAAAISSIEHNAPDALRARLAVATVLGQLGRDDEAIAAFEENIAQAAGLESPDPAFIAEAEAALATVLMRRGELARAETLLRAALERLDGVVPDNDLRLGETLSGLGECLRRRERLDDAIPVLERALAIWSERPVDALERARTRISLARALHARGFADPRIRELSAAAARDLDGAPPTEERDRARRAMQEWARRSGLPSP